MNLVLFLRNENWVGKKWIKMEDSGCRTILSCVVISAKHSSLNKYAA